jgi:hypothetical protein
MTPSTHTTDTQEEKRAAKSEAKKDGRKRK